MGSAQVIIKPEKCPECGMMSFFPKAPVPNTINLVFFARIVGLKRRLRVRRRYKMIYDLERSGRTGERIKTDTFLSSTPQKKVRLSVL